MSFRGVGIELNWQGEGEQEIAEDAESGKLLVRINPKFYRPAEVELLIGDACEGKRRSSGGRLKRPWKNSVK